MTGVHFLSGAEMDFSLRHRIQSNCLANETGDAEVSFSVWIS